MNIIKKLSAVDWEQYSGIEFYQPDKVIDSLNRLHNLTKEDENNKTYNLVLSSIGNNHSGTYYPAIECALPIIIEIARYGQTEISRNCALEILSDLYYCFEPEIGNYEKTNLQDLEKFVQSNIEQFAHKEVPQTESSRNQKLLTELLEFMTDIE